MNILNFDLKATLEELKKSSNQQPFGEHEYEIYLLSQKAIRAFEITSPIITEQIKEFDLTNQQLQKQQINNNDQPIQLDNLKEYSDTLSLSFISEQYQQQFDIQETTDWFKDLIQYGNLFEQYQINLKFIKMDSFHNILNNDFSIMIDQGYDTKLYSRYNLMKIEQVVIKEQIVSDKQFLIAAQQFLIHEQIYKIYPNNFLELIKPVYIKELVGQNKFQFTSILEYGQINLYDYSQQNLIKDLEYQLIFQQIYWQIKLLHNHNIAHRDIKPQNIVYVDNKGWMLCDFGDSFKYQDVNGIQDIRGTKAFLQKQLQLLSHIQGISIKQNLFVNDIYALAITLIIIKFQIKNQDQINNYLEQHGDSIIEQLILHTNLNNLEACFIKTEQPFIKIQFKKYQKKNFQSVTLQLLIFRAFQTFFQIRNFQLINIKMKFNQKIYPYQIRGQLKINILNILISYFIHVYLSIIIFNIYSMQNI